MATLGIVALNPTSDQATGTIEFFPRLRMAAGDLDRPLRRTKTGHAVAINSVGAFGYWITSSARSSSAFLRS